MLPLFPGVALFKISNLNNYAMMQYKAKSENLAHILGYQIWAVTMCRRAHTETRTHTRFTQVRGPREEVKPLLLLV